MRINIIALTVAGISLSACGNPQLSKDARALAQVECDAQKLSKKLLAANESGNSQDVAKLTSESLALSNKAALITSSVEKNYVSEADKLALAQAAAKALQECVP